MAKIIWLASYPKSGNTWFRVFLSNLRGETETPADINDLHATPIASARNLFDEALGVESSDLTLAEIDRLRPEIYAHIAAEADEDLFMKVHDAYSITDSNLPMFPGSATRCAIYFLRNPLDVAVSFAHHSGWDYDTAIARMASHDSSFCDKQKKLHNQLRQKLFSWSGHVKSWTENTEIDVCMIRYEDMKQDPFPTFKRAVDFAGLSFDAEDIEKAIQMSEFEKLRTQEKENGFYEKSPVSETFFRKGIIGSWREELKSDQVRRIIQDHKEVMHQFGYLDENDLPVF